jgi:hypothetical protein
MSTDLVPYLPVIDPKAIETALMVGDLSKMDAATRIQYYLALCQSSGLNPLTRPFIVLKAESGEMVWYATRECAEQLRKRHRVSMRVLSRERTEDGLYIVTVEASTPDGRVEQAQGIVPITKTKGTWKTTETGKRYFQEAKTADGEPVLQLLSGKELADALHRAESKAKRRCTLALCGLGLPEVDERQTAQAVRFDPQTGTLDDPAVPEALQQEEAGEPAPVGREAAQRNVALLFDRAPGESESMEGTP